MYGEVQEWREFRDMRVSGDRGETNWEFAISDYFNLIYGIVYYFVDFCRRKILLAPHSLNKY